MWPFKKKEESSTYTEQVTDAAMAEASGVGVSEPIAAMTSCGNLYGHSALSNALIKAHQ